MKQDIYFYFMSGNLSGLNLMILGALIKNNMLVLIASESDLENETTLLNELFNAGLQYFHLRKQFKDKEGHISYLNEINPEFHKRIVLHYHHDLVQDFDFKGVHFKEQVRLGFGNELETVTVNHQDLGNTVSSSFHHPKDIVSCNVNFDYVFLSPLFTSLSKADYQGKGYRVDDIDKTVIGMGGINETTVKRAAELGYNGVGVLGGIWHAKNPIEAFLKISEKVKSYF